MTQIQMIIGLIVAAFSVAAGIFFKGRSTGKKVEQAKQAKVEIKVQEKRNETLQTVNKINADIAVKPISDVQQRLRDKYSRD